MATLYAVTLETYVRVLADSEEQAIDLAMAHALDTEVDPDQMFSAQAYRTPNQSDELKATAVNALAAAAIE